jgi:hypothetical protein
VIHIARRLKWNEYAPLLDAALPAFDISYALEPLESGHHQYLLDHSRSVKPLELAYPDVLPDSEVDQRLRAIRDPLWLVVHSGPASEIDALLAYASQIASLRNVSPRVVVMGPGSEERVEHPHAYFPLADRIITACGFNTMRLTEPFRDRHSYLPFPRRFDDQFRRASIARSVRSAGFSQLQPAPDIEPI